MLVVFGNKSHLEKDDENFETHLNITKKWFFRVSSLNKLGFLINILDDVKSNYTLSTLLRAIWNCRPKDAVMSVAGQNVWSSFDKMPMDHNRTARPMSLLTDVMKSEQMWFRKLNPELQAVMLIELVNISGGPIMCKVLKKAQEMFETSRDAQYQHVVNNFCIPDNLKHSHDDSQQNIPQISKNEETFKYIQAEALLKTNLEKWNSTMKTLKYNLRMEEIIIPFNENTKTGWLLNRAPPETIETVDIIQLLPASVAKRILSYLPKEQLPNYARVNKYWSYLIEDFRTEMVVKQKIETEYLKLLNVILDKNPNFKLDDTKKNDKRQIIEERIGNYKSNNDSKKLITTKKLFKKCVKSEQLKIKTDRGAVDEELFHWCRNLLKIVPNTLQAKEGILSCSDVQFPCPMMKNRIEFPLRSPLLEDPIIKSSVRVKKNKIEYTVPDEIIKDKNNQYELWNKDFSRLHKIVKIPSYLYSSR